ncbi:hypothetical protein BS78_05G062500 [Paspalum vaginatum]|nr:hypothetical protein BS78_05G062500 [Paspalum vaginatum]
MATKNKESGDTTTVAAEPSVWGDFFVTYTPPPSQVRPEEWMRERAEQLKGQVRRMFVSGGKAMSIDDTLSLVDTLERLGIDSHFREEIDAALARIHSEEELDFVSCSNDDLHFAALRFCLLRQHGFWVSADVFDRFRDARGDFSMDLATDPRGLLSLYNAAHMAVPGEAALDEAIAFARRHLEVAKCKVRSPMAEQVSRALEIPRPRMMRRLEAIHYIAEYEQEEAHNTTLLELARLDFNMVRSLQLKELRDISLWWRDLYNDVKLPYARHRIVETYLYTCGVFHEEENSRARMILAKAFAFVSLLDDTYDSHATLEDSKRLTEAMQRLDESMVPILPEYMRTFYIKILSNFNDIEDTLEPWEKYRMIHIKKMFELQCEKYFQEAEWSSKNYIPSFQEHIDVSVVSTSLPLLFLVALMGAGQHATKEAFDWALGIPDMVLGCAETGRFLNDIASYKQGRKCKMDVASSLECYIKEHGVTVSDAMAAFATKVEHAWRRINQECMQLDRGILPAAQLVVNMTRINVVWYLRGRDAYSSSGSLKDTVASLFIKDFPIY